MKFLAITLLLLASRAAFAQDAVLIFAKTKGFRHASIGPAKLALMKLGRANGFRADTVITEVGRDEGAELPR